MSHSNTYSPKYSDFPHVMQIQPWAGNFSISIKGYLAAKSHSELVSFESSKRSGKVCGTNSSSSKRIFV